MKHAFVLVAAMLAATAHAQDNFCTMISTTAAKTMEARQAGVPMAKVLGAVESMQTQTLKKVIGQMVIEAYEVPRFDTPAIQENRVADFRDKWHLRCVKVGQ